MSDQQDRTEAPTARRLQRARSEGQAPMSREATALAGLGAVALAVIMGAPAVAPALVERAAAVLLQTGFLVQPHLAAPDFARLNPKRGLKRIFSVAALLESGKSVVKIA